MRNARAMIVALVAMTAMWSAAAAFANDTVPCDGDAECQGPTGPGISFCGTLPGDCGGQKVCQLQLLCLIDAPPVCGCDGTTYDNICAAQAAGASIAHDGACSLASCGIAGECSGKASLKFYSKEANTCYSLKASCKGEFVGAGWSVEIAAGGVEVDVKTNACEFPACSAQGIDPAGLSEVKADCKTQSVGACGDQSTAKASVKRQDNLCVPCCKKPNKKTGSCDDVCPEVCGDGYCGPSEDFDNCHADCAKSSMKKQCGNGVCDIGEEVFCPKDCQCGCIPSEDQETSCGDGVDNDCDGPVDCADSDCVGDAACQPGSCCTANTAPGCDDADCRDAVCAIDSFCCTGMWNSLCVGEAANFPAECGCGG